MILNERPETWVTHPLPMSPGRTNVLPNVPESQKLIPPSSATDICGVNAIVKINIPNAAGGNRRTNLTRADCLASDQEYPPVSLPCLRYGPWRPVAKPSQLEGSALA
jgi:hypothetical protein